MDKEIDPIEFIEARSKEINLLEENISKKRKKTMLFQRLPFFLRRRTQSYKPKKRKTRKKSFLTTYIGKRFFVTDTLPIKRRLKSSKFVYKSKKVFLFYEFKVKDYFIFECFNKERSIFDEIIWFTDIKNGSDLCTDEQILESKQILTVDQIFKDKQILLDDWLKENSNNFTLTSFYFKNKFVCHKSQLNKTLFKKEFCLISINEMFRIILEKKIFIKYLNVFDKNYHNFEKLAKKEEMMKNERRPLSKKQRLKYFEMMDFKYCCF
ncbi:hypothetical protein TUBRATIS_13210 [Tubulinosema ratisbonensis]|uniref:Pop1 N-terminal domain-containing protein n=1 Tax=Tubulinosema ratisbonensis TaxID=291195 RepID=A0A437AM04_9MICR|nr:hypothetical protein TUBRATIS_13210 [Tubulinosema ratisbonensis]